MSKEEMYKEKIRKLKMALLQYLGTNGRYYGELNRMEQSVEDLAQALNTRLDQLEMRLDGRCGPTPEPSPSQRLANRLLESVNRLNKGGNVDNETVDEFERTMNLLDVSADLKRQSETAKDGAETAAILHKRNRV